MMEEIERLTGHDKDAWDKEREVLAAEIEVPAQYFA